MTRILILKLGAIGDVVMALPMLKAIRHAHPEAEIDWIVGTVAAPILRSVKDSKLHLIEVEERPLYRGALKDKLRTILGLWRRLGRTSYDRILICNGDRRYGLLILPCRGPRSWFKDSPGFRGVIPGRHHSAEYVRLFAGQDDSSIGQPGYPDLELPDLSQDIRNRLGELPHPIVAISPAGAKNTMREEGLRRWTKEGYLETIRLLKAEGCSIVLVGGPGDEWASQAFAAASDLDLVGKLPLTAFVSLLSRVDVVLTHDSGPLHIADLAGTPTVAIFGPTLPDEKRPIAVPFRVVTTLEDLACRPCYDGRNYALCSDQRCMTTIAPSKVANAVLELTAGARSRALSD